MSKDGTVILKANSIVELQQKAIDLLCIKLDGSSISKVCSGKCKQYKGYTFQYIEGD